MHLLQLGGGGRPAHLGHGHHEAPASPGVGEHVHVVLPGLDRAEVGEGVALAADEPLGVGAGQAVEQQRRGARGGVEVLVAVGDAVADDQQRGVGVHHRRAELRRRPDPRGPGPLLSGVVHRWRRHVGAAHGGVAEHVEVATVVAAVGCILRARLGPVLDPARGRRVHEVVPELLGAHLGSVSRPRVPPLRVGAPLVGLGVGPVEVGDDLHRRVGLTHLGQVRRERLLGRQHEVVVGRHRQRLGECRRLGGVAPAVGRRPALEGVGGRRRLGRRLGGDPFGPRPRGSLEGRGI